MVGHSKHPEAQEITKEQLLAIIKSIEFACTILTALIPIILKIIGTFEVQQKLLEKNK